MLTEEDVKKHAERLAMLEPAFRLILERLGMPPLWARPPGFPTLIWIILEQQVSLASARAAYNRLLLICPELTPEKFLRLDDLELRQAGFSRQKTAYTRNLARAINGGELDLEHLQGQDDDEIRRSLVRLKGIGPWTADIYLLMALLRPDIWPVHDRALVVAMQRLWRADTIQTVDQVECKAHPWRPYRSTAARLLWHFYLNTSAAVDWGDPKDKY
jgi:DNA-3-methyladenine glycosylase II